MFRSQTVHLNSASFRIRPEQIITQVVCDICNCYQYEIGSKNTATCLPNANAVIFPKSPNNFRSILSTFSAYASYEYTYPSTLSTTKISPVSVLYAISLTIIGSSCPVPSSWRPNSLCVRIRMRSNRPMASLETFLFLTHVCWSMSNSSLYGQAQVYVSLADNKHSLEQGRFWHGFVL